MGGQPLTIRAVSGPVRDRRREVVHRRTAPHGQFMRLLGLAPGIDSDSVTASCDLGVLRVVMPIEQPAVRKDPLKQPAS
ncbi:Hsp20/alpha crystallin family protein [Microbacterium oxydans]|nr:Hsp20/alpha crystallin family protein [Microbacterium oxydans]